MTYSIRQAEEKDIPAITLIYNQGILDKGATLEIATRTEDERKEWLFSKSDRHKVLVIENEMGEVFGWASLNVFNTRACYSGVADISIYIRRDMRGKGLGKALLSSLIETAKAEDFHKLVLSAFNSNEAGKRLYQAVGFREVGVYEKQGQLDGKWMDVVIMEKLFV